MNRTRALFIVLILLAIAAVVAAGVMRYGDFATMMRAIQNGQLNPPPRLVVATPPAPVSQTQPANKTRLTPTAAAAAEAVPATEATATPAAEAATPAAAAAAPAAAQPTGRLAPIWGPNYKENDGLGRIVCVDALAGEPAL